jgi:hypothetical protein
LVVRYCEIAMHLGSPSSGIQEGIEVFICDDDVESGRECCYLVGWNIQILVTLVVLVKKILVEERKAPAWMVEYAIVSMKESLL